MDNQETQDTGKSRDTRHENSTRKLKDGRNQEWTSRDKRHGKRNKETKKMGGIKIGKSRETRHGKLNKETKKMK